MKSILVGFILTTMLASAQASYIATSDNVSGAHDSIRIDVLRWSTDAERDQLLTAWTNPGAPAPGGRGRGRAAIDESDPAFAGLAPPTPGRGAGGRGGRGGRGAPEAPKQTPESSLTAALGAAPTVGRLWSSEVAGYSLRYAVKLAEPDAGERIVLITDRRLGGWNDLWKPVAGTTTNYEFSVIELRLNSKGEGECKVSLTGKVAVDNAAQTIALENYGALPVVLKNTRRSRSE